MKFTESQLEQFFIELLEIEGVSHQLGQTIVRTLDEVLIKVDLNVFLHQ
jgi:type I restriction enzyme R subunit